MLNALLLVMTALPGGVARMRRRLDDRGVTAVEYGLLVALIAMVIVLAVLALGGNLSSLFNHASNCVGAANASAASTACK